MKDQDSIKRPRHAKTKGVDPTAGAAPAARAGTLVPREDEPRTAAQHTGAAVALPAVLHPLRQIPDHVRQAGRVRTVGADRTRSPIPRPLAVASALRPRASTPPTLARSRPWSPLDAHEMAESTRVPHHPLQLHDHQRAQAGLSVYFNTNVVRYPDVVGLASASRPRPCAVRASLDRETSLFVPALLPHAVVSCAGRYGGLLEPRANAPSPAPRAGRGDVACVA